MSAIIVILILIMLAAAGTILWRIITMRRIPVFVCLFLILPIGQLFLLYSLSFEEWSVFWLQGVVLSIAAMVLLLIHAILQEKKTAAEEYLRETQHRIELEKSHYNAVEKRREELDKIRREFNEKLEVAARFVRLGEEEEARESISILAENIARTREAPYCAIPVINAVLTEKEKDCVAAGITLSVNLCLPEVLAIEPMHLCSIFSNMLDNAITACKQVQNSSKITIHLSSKTDGDYLFIKSVNPSNDPPKRLRLGRGYGSRILSDLAARYGGNYKSEYKSGKFTALISLLT